jgi:O-succinylbenzoic acid--CoA ligase
MHDWLSERARVTPDALALVTAEGRWSYGELERDAARVAAGLAARGVAPGDNVAALLPNDATFVMAIHALARLGAVLVPLNARLTAEELAWQVQRVGAWSILCSEATAELAARAGGQARRIRVDELMTGDWPRLEPSPSFSLDQDQAIVFTSGTTGKPKGAVITFANHFWSATASAYRLGVQPDDRWLSCLPLYHVGGLAVIFRSCLYGTAVVLHERFDLDRFNRSLDRDRITLTSLVPTMLHRLLDAREDGWPDSLRAILLGGAAASPALLARAFARGLPIAPTYGLTEAASQVATMRPAGARAKPGSAGRPLLFTRVRIADERGETLPPGQHGEILVSGPTVVRGYYGDPAATAAAIRKGELHTGDVGYLDADGDLWVLQRRSDIIISGGENVYPAEVEAVLARFPGVTRACVVGVADAEWGQQVAALVEVAAPGGLDEADLLAHCRRHLAGYKCPRRIVFTEALPLTASGKIARVRVGEILGGVT